jgi:hypothetical protein
MELSLKEVGRNEKASSWSLGVNFWIFCATPAFCTVGTNKKKRLCFLQGSTVSFPELVRCIHVRAKTTKFDT